jgi:hypothetical protein
MFSIWMGRIKGLGSYTTEDKMCKPMCSAQSSKHHFESQSCEIESLLGTIQKECGSSPNPGLRAMIPDHALLVRAETRIIDFEFWEQIN